MAARPAKKAAAHAKGKLKGKAAKAGTRPFASQAQWRLFFARPDLRRYAKKKAHATGGHSSVTKALGFSPAYRRLPPRKGSSVKTLPLRGSKKRNSKKRAA